MQPQPYGQQLYHVDGDDARSEGDGDRGGHGDGHGHDGVMVVMVMEVAYDMIDFKIVCFDGHSFAGINPSSVLDFNGYKLKSR